jgi:hypothetical protein
MHDCVKHTVENNRPTGQLMEVDVMVEWQILGKADRTQLCYGLSQNAYYYESTREVKALTISSSQHH